MNRIKNVRRRAEDILLRAAYITMLACIVMSFVVIKQSGCRNPKELAKTIYIGGSDFARGFFYEFDVDSELEALPEALQNELQSNWTIVQSTNIEQHYAGYGQKGYSNMVGLTSLEDKVIYLSSNDLTAHYTFSHEAGHVLDYMSGWVSESEEFNRFYLAEYASYADANYRQASGYAISSPEEFFASVFCDIMLNNEENLASVPRTAAFIKSLYEGDKICY